MRTTLTLDDDLAVRLEQLRATVGGSFKDVVNSVLRRGLDAAEQPRPHAAIDLEPLPLGRRLIDIDNVSEALAIAEGDDFR